MYSSKPQDVLLGVGVGQKSRRCNCKGELRALNSGGYSSWAGVERGSQGPMDIGTSQNPFFFFFLHLPTALTLPVPESEQEIFTLDLFLFAG